MIFAQIFDSTVMGHCIWALQDCQYGRQWTAKYVDQVESVTHPRAILCHAKNGKEIYYQFEDEVVTTQADRPETIAPPASAPTSTALLAAWWS